MYQHLRIFHILWHLPPPADFHSIEIRVCSHNRGRSPEIASLLAASLVQSGPAYGQSLGKLLRWEGGATCRDSREARSSDAMEAPGEYSGGKGRCPDATPHRQCASSFIAYILFHRCLNEWGRHQRTHVSGGWSQLLCPANEPALPEAPWQQHGKMDLAKSGWVALARAALPKQTRELVPTEGLAPGGDGHLPAASTSAVPHAGSGEQLYQALPRQADSGSPWGDTGGHGLPGSLSLGFSLPGMQPVGAASPSHCQTWGHNLAVVPHGWVWQSQCNCRDVGVASCKDFQLQDLPHPELHLNSPELQKPPFP